jgi:cytochrome c5
MAQKTRITKTTQTRVKKDGTASGDYQQCRICHGTGIQKVPKKKT